MNRVCDVCGMVEATYLVEATYRDGTEWTAECGECLEGWQGWQDCDEYKVTAL